VTVQRMREREVPCSMCGVVKVHGVLSPRTMTYNLSGKCDAHESLAAQVAKHAEAIYGR
jgi:hypothetical protein